MPKPNEAPQTVEDAILANLEVAPDDETPAVEEAPVEETPVEEAPVEEVEEAPVEEAPAEESAPVEEKSEEDRAVDKEMADLGLTKPDSQARFRELANAAREGKEYRARFEEQEKVFQHMEAAGISGEQFGIMTAIAADVNSGDPGRQERAYSALQAELTALAKQLGKPAPGYNPIAEHADLKVKVEDGELDEATALELAQARARVALANQHSQRTSEQTERQNAITQGQSALNELEATLKTSDPHYMTKRAQVVAILKPQMGRISPDQWAQTYAEVYRTIPNPAPVAAVRKPAPDNASRPNGAGGGQVPKTAEQAVMQAMGLSIE
jgi:hypothetical protein